MVRLNQWQREKCSPFWRRDRKDLFIFINLGFLSLIDWPECRRVSHRGRRCGLFPNWGISWWNCSHRDWSSWRKVSLCIGPSFHCWRHREAIFCSIRDLRLDQWRQSCRGCWLVCIDNVCYLCWNISLKCSLRIIERDSFRLKLLVYFLMILCNFCKGSYCLLLSFICWVECITALIFCDLCIKFTRKHWYSKARSWVT